MARVLILGACPQSLLHIRGHLIRRVVDEGHQLLIVGDRPTPEVLDALKSWGAHHLTMAIDNEEIDSARDLKILRQLQNLMAKAQPDIFVSYAIKPLVYGLLAAWIADVPVRYGLINDLGSTLGTKADTKQYLLQKVASMLYRISPGLTESAAFDNRDDALLFCARRLVGGPEEIALINGSGVDLCDFQPTPFPDVITFLMATDLRRPGHVGDYLEAARRLRRRHPSLRIQLANLADEDSSTPDSQKVKSWENNRAIEYIGEISDIKTAITDSSVLVMPPSRTEIRRPVLEAMAMGRPIITTDTCGRPQTLNPGENGFLVPPQDPAALSQAMTHFIGEPDMVRSMGARSRYLAEQRFDIEQVTDSLLGIFELGARRIPPPLPSDVA